VWKRVLRAVAAFGRKPQTFRASGGLAATLERPRSLTACKTHLLVVPVRVEINFAGKLKDAQPVAARNELGKRGVQGLRFGLKVAEFNGLRRSPAFSTSSRRHRIVPFWVNRLRKWLMMTTLQESASFR
jgi:hypothetical protein